MTDLEMSGGGWIDASERQPTERDADQMGCVIAWHKYQGLMVTGWHQFGHNRYLTHWLPPIPSPYARERQEYDEGCDG